MNQNTAKKENQENFQCTQNELNSGFEKRRIYLDFLAKLNKIYAEFISLLYKVLFGKSGNIDNRPATDFISKVKKEASKIIQGAAANLGFDKSRFDAEKYIFAVCQYSCRIKIFKTSCRTPI